MDILKSIADNQPLFDEVKRVINAHFDKDDARTEGLSDELLGQMYRARLFGKQKLEAAFMEIASHRSRSETKPAKNPGR